MRVAEKQGERNGDNAARSSTRLGSLVPVLEQRIGC